MTTAIALLMYSFQCVQLIYNPAFTILSPLLVDSGLTTGKHQMHLWCGSIDPSYINSPQLCVQSSMLHSCQTAGVRRERERGVLSILTIMMTSPRSCWAVKSQTC